jgi:hypothetical protein
VKTENLSACVAVNCKVCRSETALYCLQSRLLCRRCQIQSSNPEPVYKLHTPLTCDIVYTLNAVDSLSKHKMSSPAQSLRSWIRIPLEAWMSVCVILYVHVVMCVGRGLATG